MIKFGNKTMRAIKAIKALCRNHSFLENETISHFLIESIMVYYFSYLCN